MQIDRGQSGGFGGHDLNVAPVWKKGLSGKGVVVTIVDDGVDHKHPDLQLNYVRTLLIDNKSIKSNFIT